MKRMRHTLPTALTAAVACFLLVPTAPAAHVIVTDCIIQGSTCIGFDCTSSESFGFETLRLKENNLRIHFDDTSSSASFPGNDWRLKANDSSNGGANYFAIEDATADRQVFRVEAGAPSNALYVEDDGDVGVGHRESGGENAVGQGRLAGAAARAGRFLRFHTAVLGCLRQRDQLLHPRRHQQLEVALPHSAGRARQLHRHRRRSGRHQPGRRGYGHGLTALCAARTEE